MKKDWREWKRGHETEEIEYLVDGGRGIVDELDTKYTDEQRSQVDLEWVEWTRDMPQQEFFSTVNYE